MRKKVWEEVIISDNDDVPGKKIIKTIKHLKIKHDASLGFYKHSKWAFNAPDELKKIAYKLGANAITGARFAFVGEYQFYSGTAVVVEDED
jgi:uncharacterized protein YbjQ (UPF0145 family)